MYDLNALYLFVQVVDHGGFGAASRALGIAKSRLSRSVALLEQRLSTRLINRTTRQFSVTELGREYYQQCTAVLAAADSAQALIERRQIEPQGVVRMSCPTTLLNFVVASLIARYMTAFPKVEIQVESTNREVDVIREGFDFALRVGFPPFEDSQLVMKTLSRSPQELVASPDLLTRLGTPVLPAELGGFPCLHSGSPEKRYEWRLDGPAGRTETVCFKPRLVTDDMITIRRVALEGGGIAQLPSLVVFKDIQHGSLVPVLPEWRPRAGVVHAVFASRRGLLPSVRSLLDFLADGMGQPDFLTRHENYALRDDDACFLIHADPQIRCASGATTSAIRRVSAYA